MGDLKHFPQLPQIGPYELTGELKTTPKSLNFNNIKLRVGDSQVKGNINLVNLDHIPGLDVELYSDVIEIRDVSNQTKKEEKKEKEESFIDKINPISKPDAENEEDTGIVFAPIIDALKLRIMDAYIKTKINMTFSLRTGPAIIREIWQNNTIN